MTNGSFGLIRPINNIQVPAGVQQEQKPCDHFGELELVVNCWLLLAMFALYGILRARR